MKKKKNKIIIISGIILILLGGILYGVMSPNNVILPPSPFRMEVITTENGGYGYEIYERDKVIISQPYIPAVSGIKSFQTKEEAERVGQLVLDRIEMGVDFYISFDDLKRLEISY